MTAFLIGKSTYINYNKFFYLFIIKFEKRSISPILINKNFFFEFFIKSFFGELRGYINTICNLILSKLFMNKIIRKIKFYF